MSGEITNCTTSHVMAETDYDPVEAKFCACLFWLVFHATEDGDFDDIPPEITCPTERNQEGGFFVRPSVVSFLCNGSIYQKVCCQILKTDESVTSLWDVMQLLAKAGFYVVDMNDEAVTEERLTGQDPFNMESHLALMDSLMVAFINKSVSIQQVIESIRRFASFNAAKELPFDSEDVFLLWLNKINVTNDSKIQKKVPASESKNESPRRFRFKRDQLIEKTPKLFPKIDDLQKDIADGKALLSLIMFYCPDVISTEDIKLTASLTEYEMIKNIDLFRELCAQHICTSIFALRTEDFIYQAAELKNNIIALLCEIFIQVESDNAASEALGDENGELEKQTMNNLNRVGNDQTKGSDKAIYSDSSSTNKQSIGDKMTEDTNKTNTKEFQGDINVQNYNEKCEAIKAQDIYGESSLIHEEGKNLGRLNTDRGHHTPQSSYDKAIGEMKSNSSKYDVQLSIEDDLRRLKLLSGSKSHESIDTLPPKPVLASAASKNAKVRQPLLSKRSKKQLANFGDGGKSQSNEDLAGLVLDDFDLKRSHSLSSVAEKANYAVDPRRSIRAWEGGKSADDVSKSNSNKISLDFKPNAAPYRSFKMTDSYTIGNKIDTELSMESFDSQKSSSEDQHFIKGQYTNTADHVEKSSVMSSEDILHWNQQDLTKSSHERPSSQRQHKPHVSRDNETNSSSSTRESAESACSEDMRRFRDDVKLKLERDKYMETENEPEFIEPQFEDDDMFGLGHDASQKPQQMTNFGPSPRPNRPIGGNINVNRRRDLKGDDDELSTIAESSEPSTPTVYSFESALTNDDSRNSILSDETGHRPDVTIQPILTHEPHEQGSSYHSETTTLYQNESSHYRSTHLDVSALEPRSSYTIINSNLSLDSAIAAGLPIIGEADTRDGRAPMQEPTSLQGPRVNRFGSEPDSDVDDVPINVRVHSRSSRSSSSGISADEVRDDVAFDADEDRPGIAVYSSLSENTAGGSPTNFDVRTDEGAVLQPVNDDNEDDTTPVQSHRDEPRVSSDITPVQKQEETINDTAGEASDQEVAGVKEKTYLSLDFDEEEQTSTSALAVCIEPLEKPPTELQNTSPGTLKHNWSYMEVELKEEDPNSVFGNGDESQVDEGNDVRTTPEKLQNGECRDRNRNRRSTTSWSEISQESSGLWKGLKKPRNEKNHCLTKEVDGPVMNWAEYAKLKNLENNQSESEDEGKSPREPLGPRLAILKMQLEEKRRHIEEEKKRMFEHLSEERRKLGQQAFWFAVGGKKPGEAEEEIDKQSVEASKKPGLVFFPFSDENDPSKISTKGKKPPLRSESPPNECSTPVTRDPAVHPTHDHKSSYERKHDQLRNRTGSRDVDYTVHQNRIGSQDVDLSVLQNRAGSQDAEFSSHPNRIGSEDFNYSVNNNLTGSSRLNEKRVTSIIERHVDGSVVVVDEDGNQLFYDDYHSIPDHINDASEAMKYESRIDSRKEVDDVRAEEGYPRGSSNSQNSPRTNSSQQKHHRTAWNEPVKISAGDFKAPAGNDFEPAFGNDQQLPDPDKHFYYDESLGNVYRRSSDEGIPEHLLPDRRAMKLVSEELYNEPFVQQARGLGFSNPPPQSQQTQPPDSWAPVSSGHQTKISPRDGAKDGRRAANSPRTTAYRDSPRQNEQHRRTPDSWDSDSGKAHKMHSERENNELADNARQTAAQDFKAAETHAEIRATDAEVLTPRSGGKPREPHQTVKNKDGFYDKDFAMLGGADESPMPRKVTSKDGTPLVDKLGVEIESPAEMTPEQMKKREKFLQSRMKRQQEEKAKKQAEAGKRKRKEEKIRERKASFDRREQDEQERMRKKKEDESRRRREEDEAERKKEEQSWRLRHYTGEQREDDRSRLPSKPHNQMSGNNNGSTGNIRQVENETFHQGSPAQSTFTEYRGPPVYVKPTGKSNRQIIVNAITHCCLSGAVNKEAKEKSLLVLSHSNSTHFFVLFREGLKFRGLYSYLQEEDEAQKIYGVGPKVISNKMVEKLYKYSSGGKSFSQIPAKSLSIQVDGILIKKECWQASKGATALPAKTDSNLKKPPTYASRSEMLRKGSPKTSRR